MGYVVTTGFFTSQWLYSGENRREGERSLAKQEERRNGKRKGRQRGRGGVGREKKESDIQTEGG